MTVVVDTKVPITANKNLDYLPCAAQCANSLLQIMTVGTLLIDEGNLIFDEYRRHLSFSGQPGPGDVFFKWLVDNRHNRNLVLQIKLAPAGNGQDEYAAFPSDQSLRNFDRSDRKFVALALSYQGDSEILNAVDSDWWIFRDALERCGLRIRHLCGTARFSHR